MGRHRKKIKLIIGILKDTVTITKSLLTAKRSASKARLVVLHATTHKHPTAPPSESRVAAVLALGHASRHAACATVGAIMDRLHGTRNVHVALKCLYTIHTVLQRGSFILKDQLSFYPVTGGRNFLNMSMFRDKTDNGTWELSSWARWHASLIEQDLTVSRVLGYHFSSKDNTASKERVEEKVSGSATGALIGELEALAGLVGLICEAPDTSGSVIQENELVYESVRLASEDYGSAQKEILYRVKEMEGRVESLSYTELGQVLDGLKGLEACKERLGSLFVNRNRNDAFWETVEEVKGKVGEAVKVKAEMKLVVVGNGSSKHGIVGLNRSGEGIPRVEDRFVAGPGGRLMLGWNQVPLTVSTVV